MKVHHIKRTYSSFGRKTHFKTSCGKIRHILTDLKTTIISSNITCKSCQKAYKHTKP